MVRVETHIKLQHRHNIKTYFSALKREIANTKIVWLKSFLFFLAGLNKIRRKTVKLKNVCLCNGKL